VGVSAVVYNFVAPAKQSIERERITAEALAQAKAALIGFAVGIRVDAGAGGSPRIGDLPCPDITNSGEAGTSCSNGGGTTIGRLPWKTLGLPDLRDGYGERLWYAVTEGFKNNPAIGTLNSDSRGGITVRDRNGTVIRNGTNPDPFVPSGAVAVVIAPGDVLRRQGASAAQDRSPGAAQLLAANYLDIANIGGNEDNADFLDSTSNGFINGAVFDANGNMIVNDRLIAIRYEDIMPLMERRVAGEVLLCLTAYASANNGRYPWAATVASGGYTDQAGNRYGRVPDPPMSQTVLGIIPVSQPLLQPVLQAACALLPALCQGNSWPASPACNLSTSTWWQNWKEQVFYGVASAYAPSVSFDFLLNVPTGIDPGGPCPTCLTVNPPSALQNKQVVIVAAGKRLATQGARPSTIAADYMEGENSSDNDVFIKQSSSTTFNDTVVYK
jgi:hypothetical protein